MKPASHLQGAFHLLAIPVIKLMAVGHKPRNLPSLFGIDMHECIIETEIESLLESKGLGLSID